MQECLNISLFQNWIRIVLC